MKRLLIALCCLSLVATATATDREILELTTLQDFESDALGTDGGWTSTGNPLVTNDDNHTSGGSKCLKISVAGDSFHAQRVYNIAEDGYYSLSLVYKVDSDFFNEHDGYLQLKLNGGDPVDLYNQCSGSVWIGENTGFQYLEAGDVELELIGASDGPSSVDVFIDDVVLIKLNVEITVTNDPGDLFTTIMIEQIGGSGGIDGVEFDFSKIVGFLDYQQETDDKGNVFLKIRGSNDEDGLSDGEEEFLPRGSGLSGVDYVGEFWFSESDGKCYVNIEHTWYITIKIAIPKPNWFPRWLKWPTGWAIEKQIPVSLKWRIKIPCSVMIQLKESSASTWEHYH